MQPHRPTTDLLIDLPSWCREDTLWSGDHRASSSPCNKVKSRVLLLTVGGADRRECGRTVQDRQWGWGVCRVSNSGMLQGKIHSHTSKQRLKMGSSATDPVRVCI